MERKPILETINTLEDFRRVPVARLPELAAEMRQFMVENVARCGGHLASSLGRGGAHHSPAPRVQKARRTKIIFDVGHQSYAHKILTGRREAFCTLRQENGISGFPKREESEHDPFNTGHASTAQSPPRSALPRAKHLLGRGRCGGRARRRRRADRRARVRRSQRRGAGGRAAHRHPQRQRNVDLRRTSARCTACS